MLEWMNIECNEAESQERRRQNIRDNNGKKIVYSILLWTHDTQKRAEYWNRQNKNDHLT